MGTLTILDFPGAIRRQKPGENQERITAPEDGEEAAALWEAVLAEDSAPDPIMLMRLKKRLLYLPHRLEKHLR